MPSRRTAPPIAATDRVLVIAVRRTNRIVIAHRFGGRTAPRVPPTHRARLFANRPTGSGGAILSDAQIKTMRLLNGSVVP